MTLKDATPFNIQWIGRAPPSSTSVVHGIRTGRAVGRLSAVLASSSSIRCFCRPTGTSRSTPGCGVPGGHRRRGMPVAAVAPGLSAPRRAGGRLSPRQGAARYQATARDVKRDPSRCGFGAQLIKKNVARLRRIVERLRWSPRRSTWSHYEHEHTYETDDLGAKADFVHRVLAPRRWSLVWDLGCNIGTYARRLASEHADYVLALDADHVVIDRLYHALAAGARHHHPAAGRRRRRPVTRSRLARPRATAARRPWLPGSHPVPGPHPPPGDRPQHSAGRADRVARRIPAPTSLSSSSAAPTPMVERLLRHRDSQELDYSRAAIEAALRQHTPLSPRRPSPPGPAPLYYARSDPPKV